MPAVCDVDGVLEPLAGLGPADDVPAAGVGRGLDVDALRHAIFLAGVDGVDIVIGDAFAAVVEVLSLDGGRAGADRDGRGVPRRLREQVVGACDGVSGAGAAAALCPSEQGFAIGGDAERRREIVGERDEGVADAELAAAGDARRVEATCVWGVAADVLILADPGDDESAMRVGGDRRLVLGARRVDVRAELAAEQSERRGEATEVDVERAVAAGRHARPGDDDVAAERARDARGEARGGRAVHAHLWPGRGGARVEAAGGDGHGRVGGGIRLPRDDDCPARQADDGRLALLVFGGGVDGEFSAGRRAGRVKPAGEDVPPGAVVGAGRARRR